MLRPLQDFLHLEASGGLVLLAATIVALVWANVATGVLHRLLEHRAHAPHRRLTSSIEDLQHVVNDGLMAIFFLVVGLEVKRELVVGELSNRQAALLPAFAALGGMVLPALIFLPSWAAATARAAGASRWPPTSPSRSAPLAAAVAARPAALVAFLLGVAVIDDIGAILVVAVYYTDTIALAWLAAALVGLAAIVVLQRMQVRDIGVYVVARPRGLVRHLRVGRPRDDRRRRARAC